MQEYEAGILRTEFRGNNSYIIDVSCDAIAREVVPGQFVQVRAGCGTDPFLRRTFSVCGVDPEHSEIRLMIEVKARGTSILCSMNRGETLNIIGSLGRGFDLHCGGDGQCVLVAGGMGVAPLLFLARELVKTAKRQVLFMMGARNTEGLRLIEGLLDKDVVLLTATEDGSSGFYGMISKLLEEKITRFSPAAIYACGPNAMMRKIASIAKNAGIPCQVSLEEKMACGIGACYGCAVQLCDGRIVRTCVDGPVFNADEVFL